MNAHAITQVANFLSVTPNQIKRCEEWASVLFVQVYGCRPRFVSKKVIKMDHYLKGLSYLAGYEVTSYEIKSLQTAPFLPREEKYVCPDGQSFTYREVMEGVYAAEQEEIRQLKESGQYPSTDLSFAGWGNGQGFEQ